MPKLTATPEMKQAAIADEPKQHEGPYGYRYVERTYLYLTQGIKSAVDYVKHIERERERKCRLYMTYGFMLKENPRSYVYCADLRCRENDPPAVRLQTLRAFREHLAQSEGRIEQSVECELDGRYRPIHMRKNYVTADFDRPIVAWLNIR